MFRGDQWRRMQASRQEIKNAWRDPRENLTPPQKKKKKKKKKK